MMNITFRTQISLCLSVCFFICVFGCRCFSLFLSLTVYASHCLCLSCVCVSVLLSVCLSLYISLSLFLPFSVSVSVSLSAILSASLSLSLFHSLYLLLSLSLTVCPQFTVSLSGRETGEYFSASFSLHHHLRKDSFCEFGSIFC